MPPGSTLKGNHMSSLIFFSSFETCQCVEEDFAGKRHSDPRMPLALLADKDCSVELRQGDLLNSNDATPGKCGRSPGLVVVLSNTAVYFDGLAFNTAPRAWW